MSTDLIDFIWILNNDTTVHPAALGHLLAAADRQPEVGVWGSTVVFAADPERVQAAGGCRYRPLTTIFRPALGGRPLAEALAHHGSVRLDYIYGAAMFGRREVFATCGLFNEEHFLFYEELDFCRRAQQAGFALGWCRESIVVHEGSATVGPAAAGDRQKLEFANYHENLSTLIYSRNFHGAWLPLILGNRFAGKVLALAWRRQLFLLRPLFQAYRDFWRLEKNQ